MNRIKKIISLLALISCVPFLSKLAIATEVEPAQQEYLIWRVDPYPGSIYSVYILGSYHIGKNCELNSPAYEHAFNDAEKVVFEVESVGDPGVELEAASFITNLIRTKGIPASPGDSLQGILGEETYKLLKQKTDKQGIPLDNIASLKPWVFLLMQQSYFMTQSEYDPDCGLDNLIAKQARTQSKPVLGLETVEYQLNLLFDRYTTIESKEIIEYLNWYARADENVEIEKEINKFFDAITSSINRGETAAVESLVSNQCQNDSEECRSMLLDRNYNWVPLIEEYLTQREDKLVVVGAGHLVGEESVIELLREKGYRVRRFHNFEVRKR